LVLSLLENTGNIELKGPFLNEYLIAPGIVIEIEVALLNGNLNFLNLLSKMFHLNESLQLEWIEHGIDPFQLLALKTCQFQGVHFFDVE
jgi:hypothetical protein